MKLLLVGATGLVGHQVLVKALADTRITQVVALVRPGLIGGERDERRPGEWVAQQALRVLHPLLPLSWRINPAERIADALLAAALNPAAGVRAITSEYLV
ncbi:hypothetical protein DZA65_03647 [Dickeya dianthicola]|uniref:NAD(P)-binding domain-containing protein n=1 Tax=Dickeya dianthicola TaxID=204039 RepID=A0AAP2GEK3_9GAMM|nr:hypothetical protein [Dickeya dianthicola]ATO34642.1 Nucleoside-diphosphate-sugar epimerase [Dickeya dianthicola RNS04.9]AYC20499.1 hypothetical protein DZA65_03647 [Dickeya dianthicola]MBI0440195.1 hypothetical protein [Dickeya dianthicola]MBI0451232.1 hypothetical protein [Dickeya dianthicola]MBI0455651.1 hypothetical protein [Dickeya dianthicola]